ncbi:MAG: hypothetical protein JNJ59_00010 [Deltaproteobacteria bacterium]|nr:hypothetical protein [Deltaproteobacteria bacterium]
MRVLPIVFVLVACSDPGSGAGPRPDLALPDATADGDTTPGPACEIGRACSDGDLCTVDDACVDGICIGRPLDCDDGVACTTDQCMGGLCRSFVASGFCHIDDTCWSDGQPNPRNPCERCEAHAASKVWTPEDGLKCNDDDPCTSGEACLGGVCQGGVRVATASCDLEVAEPHDTVESDLEDDTHVTPDVPSDTAQTDVGPIPTACTTHFDCYPERLCARWRSDAQNHCSTPCGGPGDCAAGEVCVDLPGAAQVAFCEPIPSSPPLAPAGAACTTDSDCQSSLCFERTCREVCLDQRHCTTPQTTCRAVSDPATARATGACVPNPPQSLALGQVCSSGGSYQSSVCASQHCDLTPYPNPTLPCAPLCRADTDCSPSQECGIVMYGTGPSPQSIPFHPQFQAATYASITACYTRQTAGQGISGTPCASPDQCRSGKCLTLVPGSAQRYCSAYCGTDLDCPVNMQCKPDTITLASAWLQTPFLDTQAPLPGAWSLVRVCKFR